MLRVGINRISEQEELHDWKGDDQAQCHWIAPHLNPFLVQHGEESRKGKPVHRSPPNSPQRHPRGRASARACTHFGITGRTWPAGFSLSALRGGEGGVKVGESAFRRTARPTSPSHR